MQTRSSSSSLLKGLAIAFGDGLAFGAGMKLTQSAATRHQVARLAPAADPGDDRKAMDAVVRAIETRLAQQTGDLETRIADLDRSIAGDLKTLSERDEALAQRTEENLKALRAEIVAMHREFAEAVGRIVAEHVQTEVARRLIEVEERSAAQAKRTDDEMRTLRRELAAMRVDVSETIGRALTDQVEAAVREAVDDRLGPVLRFAGVMNQACTELTSRIAPPEESAEPPRAGPIATLPDPAPPPPVEEERQGPHFSQLKRSSEPWRIPLVSSFVFATGMLALARLL
jgi:hypothetical protein